MVLMCYKYLTLDVLKTFFSFTYFGFKYYNPIFAKRFNDILDKIFSDNPSRNHIYRCILCNVFNIMNYIELL